MHGTPFQNETILRIFKLEWNQSAECRAQAFSLLFRVHILEASFSGKVSGTKGAGFVSRCLRFDVLFLSLRYFQN